MLSFEFINLSVSVVAVFHGLSAVDKYLFKYTSSQTWGQKGLAEGMPAYYSDLKHLCISSLDWFNSHISHNDKVLRLVILQFLWAMHKARLNCPGYRFSQPYN